MLPRCLFVASLVLSGSKRVCAVLLASLLFLVLPCLLSYHTLLALAEISRHVCGNGAHPTAQQRGAPQAQHGIHTGTARSAPSKESRAMEGGKSPSEASTATPILRHHRPRLPPTPLPALRR